MKNAEKKKFNIKKKINNNVLIIDDKSIFINPFFYWKRFDSNTFKWLKDFGQIPESEIRSNINRFYSELEWNKLSKKEKLIKDGTIEFFLKTLILIQEYNPNLSSEQILYIERKISILKKRSFEKLVRKLINKKAKEQLNLKRKLKREEFINNWKEWFLMEKTNQVIFPMIVIICASAFTGWFIGVSKNSCITNFDGTINNQL